MSSKFNLKDLRKSRTLLESNQAKEVLSSESETPETIIESNSSINILEASTLHSPSRPLQKRGRPPIGKRSDPNYVTALAYVRKDTYDEVRNRLFPERREYSDLIQELLEQWLKSKH